MRLRKRIIGSSSHRAVSPSTLGSSYKSSIKSNKSSQASSGSTSTGSFSSREADTFHTNIAEEKDSFLRLTSDSDDGGGSIEDSSRESWEESGTDESEEELGSSDETEDSADMSGSTSTRTTKSDASSFGFSPLPLIQFGEQSNRNHSEMEMLCERWVAASQHFFEQELPVSIFTKKPRLVRKLCFVPRSNYTKQKALTFRQAYKEVYRRHRSFQQAIVVSSDEMKKSKNSLNKNEASKSFSPKQRLGKVVNVKVNPPSSPAQPSMEKSLAHLSLNSPCNDTNNQPNAATASIATAPLCVAAALFDLPIHQKPPNNAVMKSPAFETSPLPFSMF